MSCTAENPIVARPSPGVTTSGNLSLVVEAPVPRRFGFLEAREPRYCTRLAWEGAAFGSPGPSRSSVLPPRTWMLYAITAPPWLASFP